IPLYSYVLYTYYILEQPKLNANYHNFSRRVLSKYLQLFSEDIVSEGRHSSSGITGIWKYHHSIEGTFLREPILNDELPGRIITGKVLIKPSVEAVKENSVLFKNTPKEEPVDIIVFATGYTFDFPFLDESIVKIENNQASLYKYIFPIHLEKLTLAVIGLIKPLGSLVCTSEVQARWVTRVLKGINKLPPPEVMREDVNTVKSNRGTGFGFYFKMVLQTDCVKYVDELLSFINAKPNVLSLLLVDPLLAFKVFFGPLTSYQYRLTGPGKWDGARNAIMTQWDRTFKPMKTRVVQELPHPFFTLLKVLGFLVLLVAVFLKFY
uniref:Flavin-containing monooxygenase n=1 Tax=Monodelphis domestica TaxID=13616 RepID=A0A5F8HAI9_MONDO